MFLIYLIVGQVISSHASHYTLFPHQDTVTNDAENLHIIADVTSPTPCETWCDSSSRCTGFDYQHTGVTSRTCWFTAGDWTKETRSYRADVDFYGKDEQASTSPSEYVVFKDHDTSSNNGGDLFILSNSHAKDCELWCDRKAACTGFDYSPSSLTCWFTAGDWKHTSLSPGPGVDFYGRVNLTILKPSYVLNSDLSTPSATLGLHRIMNSDSQDCENWCTAEEVCTGFAFDVSSSTCSFTDTDWARQLSNSPGTRFYGKIQPSPPTASSSSSPFTLPSWMTLPPKGATFPPFTLPSWLTLPPKPTGIPFTLPAWLTLPPSWTTTAPSSSSTSTTATYISFPGKSAPPLDHIHTLKATTVAACQDWCDHNDVCTGFTSDVQGQCTFTDGRWTTWLFGDVAGVTFYGKLTKVTTSTNYVVFPRWNSLAALGVVTGALSDTTAAVCKTWCDENNECGGFDYDSNTRKCSYATVEWPSKSFTQDDASTFYGKAIIAMRPLKYKANGTVDMYTSFADMQLVSSSSTVVLPMMANTKTEDCQAQCTQTRACSGFNFDLDTSTCTFSSMNWQSAPLTPQPNVTFYGRSRKTPESFTMLSNKMISSRMISSFVMTTQQMCSFQCLMQANCTGYNFYVDTSTCGFTSLNWQRSSLRASSNVNFYGKMDTVGSTPSQDYQVFHFMTQHQQRTANGDDDNTPTTNDNDQYVNGTVAECISLCDLQTTCKGFSYNFPAGVCSLTQTAWSSDSLKVDQSSDFFGKVRTILEPEYTMLTGEDIISPSGYLSTLSKVYDPVDCKAHCNALDACTGFMYQTTKNWGSDDVHSCYFLGIEWREADARADSSVTFYGKLRSKPQTSSAPSGGGGDGTPPPLIRPTITNVSPLSGSTGSLLTITGTGFIGDQDSVFVRFGVVDGLSKGSVPMCNVINVTSDNTVIICSVAVEVGTSGQWSVIVRGALSSTPSTQYFIGIPPAPLIGRVTVEDGTLVVRGTNFDYNNPQGVVLDISPPTSAFCSGPVLITRDRITCDLQWSDQTQGFGVRVSVSPNSNSNNNPIPPLSSSYENVTAIITKGVVKAVGPTAAPDMNHNNAPAENGSNSHPTTSSDASRSARQRHIIIGVVFAVVVVGIALGVWKVRQRYNFVVYERPQLSAGDLELINSEDLHDVVEE